MDALPNKIMQAIQVCCYIGYHATRVQPVASANIAEHYGLKKRALEAVLQQLKRNNILASTQGQSGGYYIAKPHALSLGDIARAFTSASLPQTSGGFEEFSDFLAPQLAEAYDAWVVKLNAVSVSDLCAKFTESGMPKHVEPIADYVI